MSKTESHVIPALTTEPGQHYVIKIDGEEFINHPGDYFDGLATYRETLEKETYSLCELLVWRPLFKQYIRHAFCMKG